MMHVKPWPLVGLSWNSIRCWKKHLKKHKAHPIGWVLCFFDMTGISSKPKIIRVWENERPPRLILGGQLSYRYSVIPGQQEILFTKTCKVFLHVQSVCRGCGSKRIDYCACLRALDGIGRQPVLASYHKRSDRVLSAVVIYRNIAILKTAIKIWLCIETILHRFGKLGSSADGKLIQPCEKTVKNRL